MKLLHLDSTIGTNAAGLDHNGHHRYVATGYLRFRDGRCNDITFAGYMKNSGNGYTFTH